MMYLASIFLFGTLGFTQVGHTNFNLSSSYQVAAGPSASINLGGGLEYAISIPTGTHTVSSSDVGRILALRSTTNPRHNSGLFRVRTVDSGTNRLFVDYRSTEAPPAEAATLDFKLFLSESNFSVLNNGNSLGLTAYHGFGPTADNTRIILRSPHSSSWSVRFCYETAPDSSAMGFIVTATPGMSGNSAGDFATGSYDFNNPVEHLHSSLWHNLVSFNVNRGASPGFSNANSVDTISFIRFFAWGDDQTGTTIFVNRNISSSFQNGWNSFGMVDDVGYELPPRTANRLFTLGTVPVTALTEISWLSGQVDLNTQQGVAFGLNNKPVSCCLAQYCYLGQTYGSSQNREGIKGETAATDNFLLSATELQPVELVAGTIEGNTNIATNSMTFSCFEYDPRIMGRFPMGRLGRANFSAWSTTSDASRSWIHILSGVYMPWSGPSL